MKVFVGALGGQIIDLQDSLVGLLLAHYVVRCDQIFIEV